MASRWTKFLAISSVRNWNHKWLLWRRGKGGSRVTSPDVKFWWITLVKCRFRSADMGRLCKQNVLLKLEQLCSTKTGHGRRRRRLFFECSHTWNMAVTFISCFWHMQTPKGFAGPCCFPWLTRGKPLKSWTGIQHVAAASWMLRLTQKHNLDWE